MINTVNYVMVADPSKNVLFKDFGEAMSYSLSKALFGFSVVFGVLIVIWAILSLFKVFFSGVSNDNKHAQVEVKKAVEVQPKTETVPVTDDKSIIAAITAAIMSYRTSLGENSSFRVVSFKKRK